MEKEEVSIDFILETFSLFLKMSKTDAEFTDFDSILEISNLFLKMGKTDAEFTSMDFFVEQITKDPSSSEQWTPEFKPIKYLKDFQPHSRIYVKGILNIQKREIPIFGIWYLNGDLKFIPEYTLPTEVTLDSPGEFSKKSKWTKPLEVGTDILKFLVEKILEIVIRNLFGAS